VKPEGKPVETEKEEEIKEDKWIPFDGPSSVMDRKIIC
jgi:hypothetical protein